jgi:uncharacterized protein (DUF4213/DUF364 family)
MEQDCFCRGFCISYCHELEIMDEKGILTRARKRFISELKSWCGEGCRLEDEVVASTPLTASEAIGDAGRDDFPIMRGKEVLMQAVFRGSAGQAFTSVGGSFSGTLGDVLELPLAGDFERAVLVSTMNSVLRHIGLVEKTVHCKDHGPSDCAALLGPWIAEQNADMVGLIGMQPAILESLVKVLGPESVMVSDLADPGAMRYGVRVLDGLNSSEIFERCQMVLVTGSTLVNNTIDQLMDSAKRHNRRVVFYGTTIAGAAYLLGLERWCSCSD